MALEWNPDALLSAGKPAVLPASRDVATGPARDRVTSSEAGLAKKAALTPEEQAADIVDRHSPENAATLDRAIQSERDPRARAILEQERITLRAERDATPRRQVASAKSTMKWAEVTAHPEWSKLSGDEKEATRLAYFRDVVAPQVATDDLAAVRAAFDEDTKPGLIKDSVKAVKAALPSVGSVADVVGGVTKGAYQWARDGIMGKKAPAGSVMDGPLPAQPAEKALIDQRGAPVTAETAASINAARQGANPEAAAAMLARPDWVGSTARATKANDAEAITAPTAVRDLTNSSTTAANRFLEKRGASRETAQAIITALTVGAKEKIAAGEKSADVEKWMRDQLAAGLAQAKAPPADPSVLATTAASLLQATTGLARSITAIPEVAGRFAGAVEKPFRNMTTAAGRSLGLPDWMLREQFASPADALKKVGEVPAIYGDWLKSQMDAISQGKDDDIARAFQAVGGYSKQADAALDAAMKRGDYTAMKKVLSNPGAIGSFVAQAIPSMAVAFASGGSLGVMMAMEGLGLANDARDFEAKTGIKMTDAQFTLAVAQAGIINGLLEKVGFDGIKGVTKLLSVPGAGLREAATEAAQEFNSNLAKRLYDPSQSLTEGLVASAVGGGGMGVGMGAASAGIQAARGGVAGQIARALQEGVDATGFVPGSADAAARAALSPDNAQMQRTGPAPGAPDFQASAPPGVEVQPLGVTARAARAGVKVQTRASADQMAGAAPAPTETSAIPGDTADVLSGEAAAKPAATPSGQAAATPSGQAPQPNAAATPNPEPAPTTPEGWVEPKPTSTPQAIVLQNRNRSDAAYVQQVTQIAANPDPERLSFSRDFASGAPVVIVEDEIDIPKAQMGAPSRVTAANGRKIPVQYAVVEAADLLPSNGVDGTANPEYAKGAPGRVRVVAGNGRAAGIQGAYANGTAQGYREGIPNDTDMHGVPAEAWNAMTSPVLVRIMPNEEVTANIGDESNQTGVAEKSALEKAKDDARRLDLAGLDFNADGEVSLDTARGFVDAMPVSEQTGLRNPDGQPTRQALDRLMAAIFWQAYGSDELVRLFAQATDPESRTVMAGLAAAAPQMMKLADPQVAEAGLDIRQAVTDAAGAVINAKRAGVAIAAFAKQRDMGMSQDAYSVLTMMVANIRSAKAIGEKLQNAATFAYDEATKSTDSLFGDTVPRASRDQVLEKINAQHVAAGQANLEQPAGREADDGNAGGGAQDANPPGNARPPQGGGPGGPGNREGEGGQVATPEPKPKTPPQGGVSVSGPDNAAKADLDAGLKGLGELLGAKPAAADIDAIAAQFETTPADMHAAIYNRDGIDFMDLVRADAAIKATPDAKKLVDAWAEKNAAERDAEFAKLPMAKDAGLKVGQRIEYEIGTEKRTGTITEIRADGGPTIKHGDGSRQEYAPDARIKFTVLEDAPAAPNSLDTRRAAYLEQYPIGTRVKITKYERVGSENGKWVGRTGVVTRAHWAGVYVRLDPTPRERTVKEELFTLDSGSTAIEKLADDAPAEKQEVPAAVKDRVKWALGQLRDVEFALAGVERARGRGHTLALEIEDQQAKVDKARKVLDEFRALAKGNSIDPEVTITELGGEPDLARFDVTPVKAAPKPPAAKKVAVTPQVASAAQLKTFIGIAADSIEQLRKVDVERVLTSNPIHFQTAIAQHIREKRPDLAAEVDDVLAELADPSALELAGQTQEEGKAAAEAADAKAKEEARAKAAKDEAERQARIRAEIAARSEAAAGTFELGQSAEANLSGQGDMPASPANAAELKARADLMGGLADLADLLGKNAKLNMVPEVEQKLLPVLTRIFDAAFRLGHIKFKAAAKYVLEQIRAALGNDIADQITIDHLQGAYITMAGSHRAEGAESTAAVAQVANKAEIEAYTEPAAEQAPAAEPDYHAMGVAAFKAGKPMRVPTDIILAGNKQSDAWMRGWTEANIAEPVPGLDLPGRPDPLKRGGLDSAAKPAQNAPKEPSNVQRSDPNLERDSANAAPEVVTLGAVDGAGRPIADGEAGAAGQGAGVVGGLTPGDSLVSNGGAAPPRERGDLPVYTGQVEPGPAERATRIDDGSGGDLFGDGGIQPDASGADPAAEAARPVDEAAKRRQQIAARSIPVKTGDRANIDASLPFLLDGQRDDVAFAEARFAKPEGYGVLFTNGTGTGKTYTGLGIAYRYERQGKGNILITAPTQKVIEDWVRSGKNLGLDIKALDSTSDNGKSGIVITTYANLGANDTLGRRDWDLVITDEAHYLMQEKDGNPTGFLHNLRAISMHPRGRYRLAEMRYHKEFAAFKTAMEAMDRANKEKRSGAATDALKASLNAARKAWTEAQDKTKALVESRQGRDRTRVVFLSATPFAYEKNVDYAEGYLFSYEAENTSAGYNHGSPFDRFMMQHFGYSMRTNKLTAPGPEVDSGLMQRQFNTWLKREKVLSGRMLDVKPDYDRKFVLVDSAIGRRIDEALDWLRAEGETDRAQIAGRQELHKIVASQFDYLQRRFLLEAIKAQDVIPVIKAHQALGRKVVVFHDYKKGGGFHPFKLQIPKGLEVHYSDPNSPTRGGSVKIEPIYEDFKRVFKDLISHPFEKMDSPIEALGRAFPNAQFFNGDAPIAKRKEAVSRFQADGSPYNLIVVQSAAGKEGISLHDTTGQHQRVLINLGLPTQPTTAIQQEGRIYRTGQMTDALMRYLNTGTAWERQAFANTIARRASTAENLAQGEGARALLDSFIQSFEESDTYEPGHDGEGKGGKARDKAMQQMLSEFDRAKTYYFSQQKKNSRTKSQEGNDYFATPEPVGLKMVEFLRLRGGEHSLEPSAGHGAIARWLPDNTRRRAIEQSRELATRLALAFDGEIVTGQFEDHNIVNKYDGIVMNPPFGMGGSMAFPHLEKAWRHLRDGGRIVALLPAGGMADKRLEKFLYEEDEKGKPTRPDMELVANILLPGVTFNRAGTGVMTRIIVLQRGEFDGQTIQRDYTDVEDIKDLFDRIENLDMPERPETAQTGPVGASPAVGNASPAALPATGYAQPGAAGDTFEAFNQKHSQTGADMFMAKFTARVEYAEYSAAAAIAKKHGGSWSKYANKAAGIRAGFAFKTAAARDAFVAEASQSAQNQVREPEAAYTVDLFGEPFELAAVPNAPRAGGNRPRRPAAPAGDVQPAGALQDTPAPAGQYFANTSIVKTVDRELGATRIRSAEDLAAATAYLYRSAVERFDAIVTDRGGKPLAVVGSFKGALTQTSVYPATLVAEAVRVPGAANIWFSHNHPSGTATLSPADRALHEVMVNAFNGSGIKPRDLIAVAGKNFAARFADTRNDIGDMSIPASTGSVTVPAIEREINVNEDPTRNESVTSPGMAKDAARRFYLQKGEPGVMLTDARNRVVAWVPIAPALAGALRGTGGLNAVYRAISQANAASAIMVHGGEYSASVNGVKIFQNIGAALKLVDVQPLDAINVRGPNGGAVSAAEQFQNLDAGPVFSRGDGPLKRPPMPAAAGLDVNAAREIADGLTAGWENAPPITVLATPADAPFDAPDDANGALYRGQVYLFASNLRTAADVQFTLFHETLGHTGLRGMLGAGMDAELRRIANLNAGVRKAAAIWSERFGRDAIQQRVESGMSRADARAVVRLLAIEEALADMAGSGKPITGLQRFMAKVQELLRAIGFERVADWLENATDAEVASLLAKARAWVEGDTHTTTAEELAATFSRDIAPAGAERIFYADTMEEQETRRVSAMRELRKLRKRLEDGDIDEADFVERTQALLDRLEEQAANKSGAFRNRVRGADWLRERLIRARRTGEVSIDTINLGLWLIEKNPEIVERLGISIRAQGPGEKGNAGMYDPFTRVLTLFKEGDKADTAVHEILHHTERMMPPAVQRAISKEWTKHLAEAMKDAIGELDPVRFDLLEQMLSATLGDRAAVKAVREAFDDGTLEYNDYQLYSPSEFWAVNGARILTARAEAEGSWIAQARQWLREFVQYIKGLLKLPSDSPVLKGLTNILNSNGEELSPNVLALAFDHLMSLQEADLLSAYDEAALKEKTDREEAARKAEEKARADALKPPARRVRAEQVDMFNNQQALFSRTAKTSIEANIARGRKAMNKALLDKADVNRAMWRSDLGWIDFPWGDAKKGVAHILERRQSQDGLTERAATKLLTEDLVDVIASGTTIRRTDIERASRLVIRKGAVEAILTRNNSTNGWLLSGYEIKKGGEKAAGDGAAKSTLDTPTRFRGAEGAPSGSLDDRGAGFDASAPTRSTSTPTRRGAGAGEDGSVSDGPLFNRAQAAQDAATAPAGLRARARRAIERVDALVNPLGNLPAKRAYKAERYQVLGRIARVDEIAGNIGKVFKNATEADRTAAYEYLTTAEASPLTIVGEETRRETMALKRLIGSVGDALVARGLLSEEAREEYRDRYLPRLYLKHVLGESDYRALGGGKKVSDMGYLKARRDIPEEIRQVILGEITDPGFLAATGVAKPMRDMALLDWLASIAGNIEWVDRGTVVDWLGMTVSVRWLQLEAARLRKQAAYYTPDNAAKALAMAKDMDAAVDAATDGQAPDPTLYKQIPDSARYGRLRGMWVRTEIYDDMMGVADFLPQDAGWWQSLLGYGGIGTRITQLWKMSKVALNPPGQVRNFVSNMVMLQLSGVPLHRLPDTMIRAARQIISDGPMYKVAKKYGVTAATFSTQELGRIRTDLLNLEIRTKGLHPLKRMAMIFGVITNAASEMYQFTETMFKTAKIMDGIQRQNLSEADAAIEAHDWLFDYSLVSQNVRYMRNAPIGVPFVTYFTKVLPRLLEAALLHPQRLLPWVGLYYALPALAASAFGVDDDDLDKLKKALPEWLQKRGNAFFLPYKDELGRVQAVDLGYFFPWGQWQELGGALLDTGKSLADGKSATAGLSDAMRAAGLFSGPVTDIIVALKTNEDSFTGRDIINKADPPARQWAALANYVWDMAMPPFIGSRGILSPMGLIDEQYGGKAVQAALGTTNKFGEPRNTAAQAALALIGVNMYAVDPDYTRADNMLRMQREMEDVKQRLEQQLADRGLSEERRQKLVRDYVEEIGRRQQDMLEYIDKSEVHPNLKAGQR